MADQLATSIRPSMPATDEMSPGMDDPKVTVTATEPEEPVAPEHRLPFAHRTAVLLTVILPFVALVVAMAVSWGWGFGWMPAVLMVSMTAATGFGITVGFHRLFTHRSFETGRFFQAIFAICGSMAVQGPLIVWVGTHRSHHLHSDEKMDPHSPHLYGSGMLNMLRGFWWSHVGWLFAPHPRDIHRHIGDLEGDRFTKRISDMFSLWVVLGLLLPAVIGGLVTLSWSGCLLGFLWGGLVRVLFVHHITWSVNSICHIWGSRPYRSRDQSRNNALVGILGMGEGWHNNHHAFPTSARHGLRWWEFDISWLTILVMKKLRLAWNVKVPSPELMATKRIA